MTIRNESLLLLLLLMPVNAMAGEKVRTNDALIQQKTRDNIDASNRNFAANQQAHRELMDAYDNYNKSWSDNQTVRSRSSDDFSEVMRGYRTVEDTTTGERKEVNLGYSDQIVDKLNEGDPGRYRQIPLRDQYDPLPAK